MKLIRKLSVNGIQHHVIDEAIRLDTAAPGRAIFTVVKQVDIELNQIVTFELGYSTQQKMQRLFMGLVTKVIKVGEQRLMLFCREIASVLSYPLKVNLRHVTLRDVLKVVSEKTGLKFSTAETGYSTTKVASFYSGGTGYQLMEMIGRVFNVPDYLWQQQGNGVVYVGSWADSTWAAKPNLNLPQNLFDQEKGQDSARIAAMPMLRPGLRINHKRIKELTFSKNHMELVWKT